MVGPVHARKRGHRHVTGDALVSFASGLVMGMGRGIPNLFCMAGHAGVVCLFFGFESVPAAAGVAGDTVELAPLQARTHEPQRVGVILPEVTSVGVEVRIFEGGEVIVVKEFLARGKRGREGYHLGMAGRTRGGVLVRCKSLHAMIFRSPGTVPLGAPGRPGCAPRRGHGRSHS